MSRFSKLVNKLRKKGYGKNYAGAIAYRAGEKKYGKKGMEEKALAGKRKAEHKG